MPLWNDQEQVAKRVKRKKPEFKVAQDDFVVDLKAFSELAISKKPSAGGTLALRDKSNALFLPKLNLSSKKPFLNRVGDAPQPFSTFSTSYDQPNPPLSPKSPNHRGKSFAALQSTPARDVGPSSVLPSPGLGSGIFSNPSGNLHEETMRIERIPDASTHTSLGRESVKAIGKERKPSQDSTTSGEEDLENDGTLADLLKESLAIKERKFGLARSSSSSFLPKAPIYPATGPLTAQSSESNMERLASDDLPPVKPAVPTARSQMQKKKKSALKVANTGSLKSRKSRPKEVSFSSGGEAGPSSARKKRSSSVPVAKSKGYDKEGRPTKSMKGSIIRDVAIKAESSASADELAL